MTLHLKISPAVLISGVAVPLHAVAQAGRHRHVIFLT